MEDRYINSMTKMRFRCPKHPDKETYISVTSLRTGHGCIYCAQNAKATYDEVEKTFEDRGYELLEKEYHNSKERMRFRCPYHPDRDTRISFYSLKSGHGCEYCAGHGKPTIEDIEQEFRDRGYKLISSEYENAYTPLYYICPYHPGEKRQTNYHEFHRGVGCRLCADEQNANRFRGDGSHFWKGGLSDLNNYLRHSIDEWKLNAFEKYDYTCFVTGIRGGNLNIHHPKPFNIIRDEILDDLGLNYRKKVHEYSEKEIELVMQELKKRHDDYGGIPLLEEIHKSFHRIYGNDTTKDDLIEFKRRYNNSKFII